MIFVDTSFWAAMRNRRDDHHDAAVALLESQGGEPFVTTNHVRGETWTFLRRRVGHASAVDFVTELERSAHLQIVFVGPEIEDDAIRWLRRHDERPYSFVDATSFLVMRDLKIRDVLTFDSDFTAAGFRQVSL
jgi:predicted nucleic acid-binding protein